MLKREGAFRTYLFSMVTPFILSGNYKDLQSCLKELKVKDWNEITVTDINLVLDKLELGFYKFKKKDEKIKIILKHIDGICYLL